MGGTAREGTGIVLTERQRLAWLRLIRSDNVGPSTFRDLINHFGSAERALDALPELSRRGGAARPIRVASREEAEREMERAVRIGARFVGVGEPDYPPALRQIDGAPPLLCVKGHAPTGLAPALGVVGARNASVSGAKFAAYLAREAGKAGYSVISGLARGIDAAAHRATLDFGTIAVLAGGMDKPYPPENLPLLAEIVEGRGLAITEMPLGWEPRARDFPRRNRLIAGVALGLLVVEAAARSGSLISARLAGEFGRLVFAVPGSPLDPRSEGANRLIKDGAILTTGPADVLEALAPLSRIDHVAPPVVDEPERPETDMTAPDHRARAAILDALSPTPVEIDDLIRYTGLPPATVYLVLLELDLAGRLHRHSGGRVSLALGD
ncbi:DNA protecting protein DprA [Xaviernesmea oryzae]|uniref:DNA protecting protein DprA n=1 Tax=Xaviernesmea oryzae TaxID=464029 RepID=A0A1Q9ASS1_9HYPH|nr:DNA-processing protein DprA [Xaviernesmea oryzae]OLP58453.1 DNA protecting protein DprA [Xaviernesmea oryzae]SEM22280.1 DNA processing protein [Xaviernesmea oryzae]